MHYTIDSIKALDGYKLDATFSNGERRIYDMNNIFDKLPQLKAVEKDGLFNKVKVDAGGYGVIWNDELDLDCNEIYLNGIKK